MKNKNLKFKFLSIFLIASLILSCLLVSHVIALDPYPYTSNNTKVSSALNYLRAQQGTDGKIGDFATSAWALMAIKAAGEDPNNWKVGSNPTIVDYISTNAASATTTNDYSRMILAIAAAGKDPTSFGGKNFLSLLEAAYDGTQIGDKSLLNDDFWGLMALVAAGPNTATSSPKQHIVAFILSNQNIDGGWSWGVGQASDADDTAASVMALTAAGQSASSTPITKALAYLKSTQIANGGFESWGSTNSATDSWGIDSIDASGQNSTGAYWKSGSGYYPVDDLLTFQNIDGSFNWTSTTPSNKALMTSYAITALLGTHYPVEVLSPQAPKEGVTVDIRIEGQNATIWSGTVTVNASTITDNNGTQHQLDQPTALGALDKTSQAGGFPYMVKSSAYGLYIYSVNGEKPVGTAGWTYRVDYYSPMVGVADFILDQTTPPTPPHHEILFAYSQWGQVPLKVEVSTVNPGVGEIFTVTVTKYDDGTGTWSPANNIIVHADQNYTTGADGKVVITIHNDSTILVYAEKSGYIRSNQVTVTVGTGSTKSKYRQNVSVTANIIPTISFSVNPSSINFGNLGPRDTSNPQNITITNLGASNLRITSQVTDTAEFLYVSGLKLDNVKWNVFSTTVLRNKADDCSAILTVPETYTLTGSQSGTIIFWAQEAP